VLKRDEESLSGLTTSLTWRGKKRFAGDGGRGEKAVSPALTQREQYVS